MTDEAVPLAPSILVVEDDAGTRTLLLRFLQENGYRATGVRNGIEMWDALRQAPVDLMLLDVMLPGVTGLDLCRAVRKDNSVPIIMLTARGSETDRVLGLEMGADDYVPAAIFALLVGGWTRGAENFSRPVASRSTCRRRNMMC